EPHGTLLVASAAEHLALDLQSFSRARVGGNCCVDQRVGFAWLGSGKQPRKLYLRTIGIRIKLDGLIKQRLRLGSIVQTHSRDTERGPDFALEGWLAITGLHKLNYVGEFLLAKQCLGQHRQVVSLIAVALAGGP